MLKFMHDSFSYLLAYRVRDKLQSNYNLQPTKFVGVTADYPATSSPLLKIGGYVVTTEPTTVLLRTTLTQTITLCYLLILLGSNH